MNCKTAGCILLFVIIVVGVALGTVPLPQVKANPDSGTWQVNGGTDDGRVHDVDDAVHPPWQGIILDTGSGSVGAEWDDDNGWYFYTGFGLRFNNVTVPNGAIISSAYIQLCSSSGSYTGSTVNLRLAAEDADDAATFSTIADYNGRSKTSYVAWSDLGGWTLNTWYNSTNVSSCLQTVVDRVGWTSGNSIVVFCEDDGTSTNIRYAHFYEDDPPQAAKLFVEWTPLVSNTAPSNGSPTTSWDDTDNCYAQYRYYNISVVYTDSDGAADFDYVQLSLIDSGFGRNTFRYTEATDTFSIQAGTTFELNTTASLAVEAGDTITVSWMFKPRWNVSELEEANFEVYCVDDAAASDNDTVYKDFNLITRLVTTDLQTDDGRTDVGDGVDIGGNVRYALGVGINTPSTKYPPIEEWNNVIIHTSTHAVWLTIIPANDSSFLKGGIISEVVQNNVYHVFVDMLDPEYVDQDAADGDTVSVIGDRIHDVTAFASADSRINVNSSATVTVVLHYDYDETDVTDGTVLINGVVASPTGWGGWSIQPTSAVVGATTYDTVVCNGNAYLITNVSISSSVTQVWDRIKINAGSLTAVDGRVNANSLGQFWCTAESEYDAHALGSGDSLTLSGYAFTWDGTDSRFEYNTTQAVTKITINALTNINEVSYGITVGNINGNSAQIIWDSLSTDNIQPVQYQGNGKYLYEAQIKYGYDSSVINAATVGVAYPNGTGIGSLASNATGWITFTITQSNCTSGTLAVYGINDNSEGITVTGANTSFALKSWTVNPEDGDGAALTGTTVTVNVSSTTVWAGNTLVYVPPDTFNVTITWLQGLVLNTTTNAVISADTVTDFACNAYSFTYSGTTFWAGSNVTINSRTYSSSILTLGFNSTAGNYTLVSSCTTQPSYLVNCTYDLDTDFTVGYLVVAHYGNCTIQLGYENWGGFNVKSVDHRITTVGWSGQRLTVIMTGSSGEIGVMKVFCSSRGAPAADSGFSSTSYSASVLTGNFVFASDVTLYMEWSGSGGGTGVGEGSHLVNLLVDVAFKLPGRLVTGKAVNGTLNLTWTGYPIIYLWSINCAAPYNDWAPTVRGLPLALTQNLETGLVQVLVELHVPKDSPVGSAIVPVDVEVATPDGNKKTVRTVVTLEVAVDELPPLSIPDYMTFLFLGLIVAVPLLTVFRKQRGSKTR